MQYKINTPIKVNYLSVDKETGLTDLLLTPINPSDVDQTPITFAEIGDGLYAASFTPNVIGIWTVRVTSILAPENIYAASYDVGTEYDKYPPQEDGNLATLNTKVGEVQTTPTTNTVLGRLKDLWDKLNDLFTNGTAKVKLWDGTNQATVGQKDTTAVGVNTLPVGVYKASPTTLTDNQVYPLQLDTQGRLLTTQSAITRRTIELSYITASIGPYVSNMWRQVLAYTVPASYQFEATEFNANAGNIAGSARVNRIRILGNYNIATSTFSDGVAYISPSFCTSVEAQVTTILTGTAVTLTVTYTNQDGESGRTGTIVLTAGAAVGHRFLMTLQGSDFGVRDAVVVSKSGGTSGIVALYGITTLMQERLNTADQTYPRFAARESIIVEAGDMISLEITSTSTTSTSRMVKVLGILSPV